MSGVEFREVIFVASSQEDLRAFPEDVRYVMGLALYEAQRGGKHPAAKSLKGFKGSGVLEIVDDHDGDTYRVVYTLRLEDSIYVLHAFQKKSKKGIATAQHDVDLIAKRLALAERIHGERQGDKRGKSR
jgi:phage-related protein